MKVEGEFSRSVPLTSGVPQGSVLGLQLFKIVMSPLGEVIHPHGLGYLLYADDGQAYKVFNPTQECTDLAVTKVENCVLEVCSWMTENMLKCNEDKTEVTLFGTRQQLAKISVPHLNLNGSVVNLSSIMCHLGVMFDEHMNMDSQVRAIVKSACCHLCNV